MARGLRYVLTRAAPDDEPPRTYLHRFDAFADAQPHDTLLGILAKHIGSTATLLCRLSVARPSAIRPHANLLNGMTKVPERRVVERPEGAYFLPQGVDATSHAS